jgi:hypothetical protein
MEPTAQPSSGQNPPSAPVPQPVAPPQAAATAQPQAVALVPHTRTSYVVGFMFAVLFAAAGTGLLMVNKIYSAKLEEASNKMSQLELLMPQDSHVTAIGPVSNGVFKVDDSVLIMVDLNGKPWIVKYTAAAFGKYSSTTATQEGTDGKASTTLSEWVESQPFITGSKHVPDIEGRTTIEGTLKIREGVLYADTIRVNTP